jgi:hypothetical protein
MVVRRSGRVRVDKCRELADPSNGDSRRGVNIAGTNPVPFIKLNVISWNMFSVNSYWISLAGQEFQAILN